jgi:arabinan endo-1,5-alpha-L-arabinosidase
MEKFRGYFLIFLLIAPGLFNCTPRTSALKHTSEAVKGNSANQLPGNPVIDINFPDPTIIKAHDGFYYVYATNTELKGKLIHIQVARSKDLRDWEMMGDALPEKPAWSDKDFWAPHVLYDSLAHTYFLYYSGESLDGSIGKCLGVATSKSPEGPFSDKGNPLLCGEGFEEIDPMAFDDPLTGEKFLYWGSGHEPIKVQELADNRLNFKSGSKPLEILDIIENEHPDNYQKLVEGPWVVYKKGYYYLFYSGDNCCGEGAHYAVMVARSKKATGPFETLAEAKGVNNSVILEGNGKWVATGHNSLIVDSSGQEWIAYHAIDSTDKEKGRVMLMDKINWANGWPQILTQD